MKATVSAILLACTVAFGQGGTNTKPPFSLRVEAPANVAAGSEIVATISLTNTSNSEITIMVSPGKEHGELEMNVIVRDESGKDAEPTSYWRKTRTGVGGSWKYIKLSPGGVYEEHIKLNRLYDLSESGTYTVQVRRSVPKGLGEGFIESNVVKLNIITY